jgi:hypothetical protein
MQQLSASGGREPTETEHVDHQKADTPFRDMKNTNTPALIEYDLNDDVLLVDRNGNVPSGAAGRILGKIPRPSGRPSYIVSFVDQRVDVLSVRFDEILLMDTRTYA